MLIAHEYDSASRPPRAVEELLDVTAHGPLVLALIARNIKVRYKRSVLGVAWTMAQPATMLLVLTLIFARTFAPDAPTYALYLAPGLILWHFFAQTTTIVIAEVAAGVELWRRVRIPKTALAIATTCTGLLNLVMATMPLLVLVALARVPSAPRCWPSRRRRFSPRSSPSGSRWPSPRWPSISPTPPISTRCCSSPGCSSRR